MNDFLIEYLSMKKIEKIDLLQKKKKLNEIFTNTISVIDVGAHQGEYMSSIAKNFKKLFSILF